MRRLFRSQTQRRTEVFSYYSNRSENIDSIGRQQSGLKKRRRSWLHHLPTMLAGLGLLISLAYVLSLSTEPKIIQASTATQDQTFLRSPTQYQQMVAAVLKTSIWNRSKLTLNTEDLATKIQTKFPELSDVAVSVPLISRRPIVELAPARPAVILASQGSNYILDFKGRAIINASDAMHVDTTNLPLVSDQSSLAVQLGKSVLISDNVAFVREINAQLQAKKLGVQSFVLPAVPNELQLHLRDQTYYVKFDMLGDARTQTGTLLAVKAKLDAAHQTPKEYIDVRVEERAYYK